MSCRLASAYRVSPATNSCATCRLNSMLWERCLAMAFILRKPSSPCQITKLNLSGPRGALQDEVELQAQQPSAIAPVHADVCLLQVTLAALQKLETGESRGNDLNSKQGL